MSCLSHHIVTKTWPIHKGGAFFSVFFLFHNLFWFLFFSFFALFLLIFFVRIFYSFLYFDQISSLGCALRGGGVWHFAIIAQPSTEYFFLTYRLKNEWFFARRKRKRKKKIKSIGSAVKGVPHRKTIPCNKTVQGVLVKLMTVYNKWVYVKKRCIYSRLCPPQ